MPIAKLRYMSIECIWLLLSASFPLSFSLCVCAEIEKYGKVATDLCIILFNSVAAHKTQK